MSLFECLGQKMKNGLVSGIKGKKARDRFKELSDGMISQGENATNAYAAAADIVLEETKRRAAEQKHRLLAKVAVAKDLSARVDAAENLKTVATSMVDDLDFDARAIHHMATGRIASFLEANGPGLSGSVRRPAQMVEVFKSMRGEATADAEAAAFASAINDMNEWFRIELNRYGHSIAKREGWGITQTHNAVSIWRNGDKWFSDLKPDLEWTKMIDPRTGKNFERVPSIEFQDEFLAAANDSIVYGRTSKAAKLGRYGIGSGNPLEKSRVFEFKSAEAWLKYNNKYGTSDPFNSLMQHIDHMSRRVALARRFGPDEEAGADFVGQLVAKKSRDGKVGLKDARIAMGNAAVAKNMVRYMTGGVGPSGWHGAVSAKFFSTTRKLLQGALLDRAAIISIPSDLNSARMAADMIGLNKSNMLSTYVGLMQDSLKGGGATRDDLMRQLHIADSFANPSVTSSRYQQEFPAYAWAEKLSNAAMQIQGLMAHTDNLKLAFQKSFSAEFASRMKSSWSDLPDVLRADMAKRGGITEAEWDAFRSSGGEFVTADGAIFLDPLYWREANGLADREAADNLAIKMQAYVEKWTELAVPSGSLIAKGVIDPLSYGLSPGSPFYELAKSAGMFKSFVGAFAINQVRIINGKPTMGARAAYIAELVGTSTVVGALATQFGDMLLGRDPQDMTQPEFIFRAMLRGGGLGPIGDILSTGSASWGGGFGSYAAGPVAQLATDFSQLTLGNLVTAISQVLKGKNVDVKFAQDLARFIKRYTPLGQTPVLAGGAAFDRLIADQLQLLLDPDSADAMAKASKKRKKDYGGGEYWLPGEIIPGRLPNLRTAIGG